MKNKTISPAYCVTQQTSYDTWSFFYLWSMMFSKYCNWQIRNCLTGQSDAAFVWKWHIRVMITWIQLTHHHSRFHYGGAVSLQNCLSAPHLYVILGNDHNSLKDMPQLIRPVIWPKQQKHFQKAIKKYKMRQFQLLFHFW